MASVTYSHKLNESKYNNWVKAGLAVLFTKEGIQPFVNDEIEQFQQKCLTDICNNNGLPVGTTCSSCCTENVVRCPTNKICNVRHGNCSFHRNSSTQFHPSGCTNKICHNFKTEIQNAHWYNGPSFRNTDATQWCSNPWEVAKCFMPPDGYRDVTGAAETDLNGIINVIMNYKGFQSKVHDINIFNEARNIGKAIRHSPTFEVKDTDLQQYFTDLQKLLSDPGYLATNVDAQNARQKLSQLENDTLVIGKDDVRKVLDDVTKAVQDKIRTEGEQVENLRLELIRITNSSINSIKGQEKVSMSEFNAAFTSALSKIKKQTKSSAKRLQIMSTEGIVAAKKIKKELECIKTESSSGVEKIASKCNNAVEQIQVSTEEGVKKVETKADVGEKMIVSETDNSVQQIKVSTNEGVKKVETGADTAVKNIAEETDNAVKQIKAGTEEGVKKVEIAVDARLKTIESKADDALRRIGEKVEKGNAQSEDLMYNKLKKDFQSDLTAYYKEICSTIPIFPGLDEVDAPFMKVYIPPYPLYSQETDKLKQLSKQGKEQETNVSKELPVYSLQKIFNRESEEYKHIYLTAESGLGKTSFVKWLALNWCQAHSPVNNECGYFDENDVNQIKLFEFLFVVFLRETDVNDMHVDYMIRHNVISALARQTSYTPEFLEKVMFNEKCLIILDGLDEWMESGVPKRSVSKTCTYLTTSRPWRFCMLSLDSTSIDQQVCIQNVRQICSKKLISRVLSIFEERGRLRDDVLGVDDACQIFETMLVKKEITQFYNAPVILLQLLYLWNMTKEIGNSQCEIYGDVVDALFSIAEKKVQLLGKFKYQLPSNITFFQNSFCEYYYSLLIKLGKLAFETLFSENKGSSLVFNETVAFKYLPADENATTDVVLSTCLQTGLLTKQSVYVKARRKQYTFSFYHKTVQEYFAALYIQSEYANRVHVSDVIRKRCSSVSSILEMETVFMFLSGFNPSLASVTLQSLQSTIDEDEKTDMYRCRYLRCYDKEFRQMNAIQNMLVSCVTEIRTNGHGDQYLPLMDIIIDDSCGKESYSASLKILLKSNSKKIQSLTVSKFRFTPDKMYHQHFELSEVRSVCKLQVDYISISNDLYDVFARSAQYLRCLAVPIDSNCDFVQVITDKLGRRTHELETLYLFSHGSVTQSILEKLIQIVFHQTLLQEVKLEIECYVHATCNVPLLHLCQHKHLMKLSLENVPLKHLQLNDHLLELHLDHVPLTHLQLNAHLQKLTLKDVPLQTLQTYDHLKELALTNMPLTELQLSDHLQNLTLDNVPLKHLQLNVDLQMLTLRKGQLSYLQCNDNLQKLTLVQVPLTHLQLNDNLQGLTLKEVPLTHLQLNDHLQLGEHLERLSLTKVSLTHLQLNDHLKAFTLNDAPLTQLQLGEHLEWLSLTKVSLAHLQLNDHLQMLTLEEVPLTHLQLNDHLQTLRLEEVPLAHLQLNDLLLRLTLRNVSLQELQLNVHLKECVMIYGPKNPLPHMWSYFGKYVQKNELIGIEMSNEKSGVLLKQLQLNDKLERLILVNVPLSQLQLNHHLKELVMQHVPVSKLQLNEQLQKLFIRNVPVSILQLNTKLEELEMHDVLLTQLQTNGQLQTLKLTNVALSDLQLDDHLQKLQLNDVPITRLLLGDHLQKLKMKNVPLPNLELNVTLKDLSLKKVPITHLQLNDHLQTLTLEIVALTYLLLNDDLKQLKLEDVPLTQLHLSGHLETLTLRKVSLKHVQLTDHLKAFELFDAPLTQLKLGEHLERLSLTKVLLTHLQLNDHLKAFTLDDAPLTLLQLGKHLKILTLRKVLLTHLQLNDHLQNLTLDNVPLKHLQLDVDVRILTLRKGQLSYLQCNDHLQKLTLEEVPLTHLQLNDHLQTLTLKEVPLTHLQLNDHLQTLILEEVPLTHLQLNDHLQTLTLEEVQLTHLQLNDLLLKLTLRNVSLQELQLNGHLKEFVMIYGPKNQLYLNKLMWSSSIYCKHARKLNSGLIEMSNKNRGVLLKQLQLNDQLERLILVNVPLSQLQLNHHLKELVIQHVPVSTLQLNEQLQKLFIRKAPVSILQLNAKLEELEIHDVLLTKLQTNDQLQKLTLTKIPLSDLQLDKHLQTLTIKDVPLPHLQLNDNLQELTLKGVPLTNLQIDDNLQKLTLNGVPLTQLKLNGQLNELTLKNMQLSRLQLGDHLQKLTLKNITLPNLLLNDHLKELTLENVPLTHLQLDDQLQVLTLKKLFITHLQSNDHLQTLSLTDTRPMYLQLDEHTSHIRNIHLISISLTSSTLDVFLDTVMDFEQYVSVELRDITLNATIKREHQETVRITKNIYQRLTSNKKSLKLYDFNITSKVLQNIVDTVLKSVHPVTVSLCRVTVKDVTSTQQHDTLNQDDTSVLALRAHRFTHGMKKFHLSYETISYETFKQFVDTVQGSRYPVTVELFGCNRDVYYKEKIEYVRSLPFTIVEDYETFLGCNVSLTLP